MQELFEITTQEVKTNSTNEWRHVGTYRGRN